MTPPPGQPSRPGSLHDDSPFGTLELATLGELREKVRQLEQTNKQLNDELADAKARMIVMEHDWLVMRQGCIDKHAIINETIAEWRDSRLENTQTQLRSLAEQNAQLRREREAKEEEISKAKREVIMMVLKAIGTLIMGGGLYRILEALSKH